MNPQEYINKVRQQEQQAALQNAIQQGKVDVVYQVNDSKNQVEPGIIYGLIFFGILVIGAILLRGQNKK